MKCKNCGADYRTYKGKCPYCGTSSRLGRVWATERSIAEQRYDEARLQRNQKYSPFILNRWLNRGILIALSVLVLGFLATLAASGIEKGLPALEYKRHTQEIEAQLEESFEDGDYQNVRAILRKYDLYGKDHYAYSQAAFMYYDFRSYSTEKYAVIEDILTEGTTSDFQLSYLLSEARRVYTLNLGSYSLLSPKNEDYYQANCQDIRGFLVGYLGMTEEEWAVFADTEGYSYPADEMAQTLLERRAWEHE